MKFDPRLHDSVRRLEAATVDESEELSRVARLETLPRADRPSSGMTIFIPNWNHESVLPRALKDAFEAASALRNEGFGVEILVIDDASRDGSLKLMRTLQAIYYRDDLRVVSLKKNYGQARLTNLALQISRFRYVLRLDSDNQLIPQNVTAFLRSSIETRASLLYGNLIALRDGEIYEKLGMVSNMPATMHLTNYNYIDALCVMDAFDIMDLGGYTKLNPYSPEDWEMNLHLIAHEKLIVFVPLLMGYYNFNPLSASAELPLSDTGPKAIRRVYAQAGRRAWDRKRVGRIYLPRIGFIDEWGF